MEDKSKNQSHGADQHSDQNNQSRNGGTNPGSNKQNTGGSAKEGKGSDQGATTGNKKKDFKGRL